eukprot:TRINITY_DN77496_c0_g1_i1.p1 TRINITY_DN77496_c0_g1~~TRINITY_DN77496_c0_g1_i1.p1  ORF type:complete len:169 (-),score=31.63 TRINITY_DN77496_c0_g1_i1:416-922(-)
MVFVREFQVELGVLGPHIVLVCEHIFSGAGGQDRRTRDAGKKFIGATEVAAKLECKNVARWKPVLSVVQTMSGPEKETPSAGSFLFLPTCEALAKLREDIEALTKVAKYQGSEFQILGHEGGMQTAAVVLTVAKIGDAKNALVDVRQLVERCEWPTEWGEGDDEEDEE